MFKMTIFKMKMFKKICAVLFVGFVIVGCDNTTEISEEVLVSANDEKEVTADMLVGDWLCDAAVKFTTIKDGEQHESDVDNIDMDEVSLSYFKDDSDTLFLTFPDNPYPPESIADFTVKSDVTSEEGMRSQFEYIYISNDEYKTVGRNELEAKEPGSLVDVVYLNEHCLRVKEQ